MSASNIISLLGGLGAFLFGMKYMGEGLEMAAGSKMKDLLEKLTRNRFRGFLLGMLVTVVIQSSSATTVMVMGFINAGIMDLFQATSVIFGANIGTTITSVLIALDASGIAPFCIFVGAALMLYGPKRQYRLWGQVILGFGLLFQGLHTMSAAMKPLKDVLWFQEFILNATNPVLGLLIGAGMCAVIQSSSAAVGIVQALAMQGMMPLNFASFLVCGINIGSAMPTILASLKARNNAKRASVIYLINNLVGAIIMVPITLLLPYTDWVAALIPDPAFQVSMIHIIFKVVSAVVLLPMTNLVVELTYKVIPKQVHEDACRLQFIDVNLVGSPSVTMLQIRNEVDRMSSLVKENLTMAHEDAINWKPAHEKEIVQNESVIDYLTDAISEFLVKLNIQDISVRDANYVTRVYQALNDLERIGDYAEIMLHLVEKGVDQGIDFSEDAQTELVEMYEEAFNLYQRAVAGFYDQNMSLDELKKLTRLQRTIRKQSNASQQKHMERMRRGECSTGAGLLFGEMLNCLSRIGGHAINIAEVSISAPASAE